MKMPKEDEELLTQFATATLQGWMSRFPEGESLSKINYNIVARGCYMMAKSMLMVHKQVVNDAPPAKLKD